MSRASLEQRVSVLESQVQTLLANKAAEPQPDLRSLRGAFSGDKVMRQIFEEGRKIREAERDKPRRQVGKRRKARS